MRAGGFLFCVWRLKGFTLRYPIIVMIYRSNPLVECMPLYGLRNAKSYTCNPPQFDLKKLFQKISKTNVHFEVRWFEGLRKGTFQTPPLSRQRKEVRT